jgi:membrane-associated phospholipid phosphatase
MSDARGPELGAPDDPAMTPPHPALPAPLRRPTALAATLAAAVAIALGALYSGRSTPSLVDDRVQSAVDAVRVVPRRCALLIDSLGDPRVAAILVAVLATLCLILQRRRLAVVAVVGPTATGVATTVSKPIVGRTIHGDFLSYPSGHAAVVTALAFVVALLITDLTRTRRPARVLLVIGGAAAGGAVMAWDQILLGAHYFTDTIGGFCTALAILTATAWLVDRMSAALQSDGSSRHRRGA